MANTGKPEKSESRNRNCAWLVCLATVLVTGVLMTACGGQEGNETAAPTEQTQAVTAAAAATEPQPAVLTVDSIKEQGDTVVVSTSYCQLKYPFAFADLIEVEAVNEQDRAELIFSVKLDLSAYKLFSVTFGGSEGILLGTMDIPGADAPVEVYAALYQLDDALGDNFASTFNAAQESFNDVALSLTENEGFTPAQ